MKGIILSVLGWIFSRLFGGGESTQARDDAVNLGKATNELEHVEQETKDREALASVKPVGPSDASDRLRDGSF